MTRHKHAVAVLKSDGTAFAITHWDRPEDALTQFEASLRLAGHHEHAVKRHLEAWERMPLHQGVNFYQVLNPDLQGSIRISVTQPRGG